MACGRRAGGGQEVDAYHHRHRRRLQPYNLTKPDGTLDGYEIELAHYLCNHMKIECKIVAQSFDGMIPALNAGKFDAIMAGMSATEKREKVIDFSTPTVAPARPSQR